MGIGSWWVGWMAGRLPRRCERVRPRAWSGAAARIGGTGGPKIRHTVPVIFAVLIAVAGLGWLAWFVVGMERARRSLNARLDAVDAQNDETERRIAELRRR